jgi:hypothetical protein
LRPPAVPMAPIDPGAAGWWFLWLAVQYPGGEPLGQRSGHMDGGLGLFALASAGATWIMGADRAEAVASVDGGGPSVLGRFSARFGTPVGADHGRQCPGRRH